MAIISWFSFYSLLFDLAPDLKLLAASCPPLFPLFSLRSFPFFYDGGGFQLPQAEIHFSPFFPWCLQDEFKPPVCLSVCLFFSLTADHRQRERERPKSKARCSSKIMKGWPILKPLLFGSNFELCSKFDGGSREKRQTDRHAGRLTVQLSSNSRGELDWQAQQGSKLLPDNSTVVVVVLLLLPRLKECA